MEYDWDSVEIGQPQINDSQDFFRKLKIKCKLRNLKFSKMKFVKFDLQSYDIIFMKRMQPSAKVIIILFSTTIYN